MRLYLLVGGILLGAASLQANENSCVLVQRLAANLGCVGTVPGLGADQKNFNDELISNTFGGEQCATAKALDDAKAAQKKDCNAWIADQKKELGSRFVTGSCKSACQPCPDTLQKCATTGEVRYRLDNKK